MGGGGGQEQGPELVPEGACKGDMRKFCRGPEDPRGRPASEALPALIPSRSTRPPDHTAVVPPVSRRSDSTTPVSSDQNWVSHRKQEEPTVQRARLRRTAADHREALMRIVDTPVPVPPAREHLALRRPI